MGPWPPQLRSSDVGRGNRWTQVKPMGAGHRPFFQGLLGAKRQEKSLCPTMVNRGMNLGTTDWRKVLR